jgi:transposase
MLVVETIRRLRREHLVKGRAIKEIARELKVSRNTVRKVLRSGPTAFEYAREVQPPPKLGVFDAHDRAFAFFRGTCSRGIYDNTTTAIETVFIGKDRAFNRRFLQICSHYLIEPTACTPAAGWEKGRRRARSRMRSAWCASASSRHGCGSRATTR